MLLKTRRQYDAGEIGVDELRERIEQVRTILAEATRILSLEDPLSPEGTMGTAAVQANEQLQRWAASL